MLPFCFAAEEQFARDGVCGDEDDGAGKARSWVLASGLEVKLYGFTVHALNLPLLAPYLLRFLGTFGFLSC